MSSKTTRKNQKERMRLGELRANDLLRALDQAHTILSDIGDDADDAASRARKVLEDAMKTDIQRTEPVRIKRAVREMQDTIREAKREVEARADAE